MGVRVSTTVVAIGSVPAPPPEGPGLLSTTRYRSVPSNDDGTDHTISLLDVMRSMSVPCIRAAAVPPEV